MNRREYTTNQASRVTGVSYDVLDSWAKRGFLPPSVSIGIGPGSHRLYSHIDLIVISIASLLRLPGCKLKTIRNLRNFIEEKSELTIPYIESVLFGKQSGLFGVTIIVLGEDDFKEVDRADGMFSPTIQNEFCRGVFLAIRLGAVTRSIRKRIDSFREEEE